MKSSVTPSGGVIDPAGDFALSPWMLSDQKILTSHCKTIKKPEMQADSVFYRLESKVFSHQ